MTNKKRLTVSILCLLMLIVSMFAFSACGGGKVENFNLSFKVDGESYSTISTNGAEVVAIPENPSKEGYTFDGWYWDKDVWSKPFTANSLMDAPISSDMSVYAKFSAIEYDITYENDGGTHNNPVSYTIEDGFTLSAAEKLGYSFVAWYSDDAYTTKVESVSVGSTGAISLYAKFEIENYTISYENTKDVPNTNATGYNVNTDTITLSDLSKTGYTFEGWYNGEQRVTEIAKGSTGNLTLTARWSVDGYSITYHNTEGSTNTNPNGYDVEDLPLTLSNASKDYYNFLGWYTEATFENKVTEIAVGTTGNINLYAKWEAVEYTATFKDGNTVVDEIKFTVETDSITAPAVPTHTGYTGVWESYTLGTENITVNAVYTAIEYTATFKDGETIVDTVKFTVETDSITAPAVPTHTGYTGVWESYTLGTENVTVNAVYTAIEYTATFKDGETIVGTVKFTVETDSITAPAVPTHTGYTGAWENYTLGTEDIVINAIYSKVDYTISYHNMTGANHTNPSGYNVETLPIVLEDATKRGYTFLGWYTEPTFENKVSEIVEGTTGNINLYAKWEIIEYTATFKDGNTVVQEIVFTVETDSITAPAVPVHTGYTGVWESYTLGTENITIDAIYTAIEYTATFKEGSKVVGTVKFTVETVSITEPTVPNHVGYTGVWESYSLGAQNITIDAVYTAIEYTATFKDGDTIVDEIIFTVETESINEPNVPAHTGYTGKWEEYTLGTQDITINAIYEIVPYGIIYHNTTGATHSNPTGYDVEDQPIILKDASKTGYKFIGWYTDATFENKVTEIEIGTTETINLYAKWEAIEYTITYLYDADLGYFADDVVVKVTYTIEDAFDFASLLCKKEGYTFDGWFTEKNIGTGKKVNGVSRGTMGDISVYAHFGLKEYTITYNNVNGATNTNPTNYTVESEDISIYPLSQKGYTFDGWYVNEDCSVAANTIIANGSTGDIVLYAKWTPIVYTIEYVTFGGTTVGNPPTYIITDNITFKDATLSGYVFKGWYTAADGGVKTTCITAGTTGNIVLYAHWDYVSTITFETNGGSSVMPLINVEGTSITAPASPTKEHYEFVGWYSDSALTNAYSFTTQPAENITLYAKWTPVSYEIQYVLNGGVNSKDNVLHYTIEDTVTLYDPSKVGYTFIGWFTDAQFTSAVVTEIQEGTSGKITLYAHYSINQYTISFDSNGGTNVSAITQNYASNVVAPENPSKNGYVFAGWYSNASLMSKYTFSTMPAQNITLYAKWQKVTYTITYNLDGGRNSTSNPSSYTITSNTITFAEPTKNGYTFDGWYTDSKYTTPITEITSGSYGDVEIFAKWVINTYTITYHMPESATHSNITQYTIESDIYSLLDAALVGHTFAGWYSDSDYTNEITAIAGGEFGNIELFAKFTANTYNAWLDGTEEASVNVSFNLNGASGSIATQTITETKALVYPTIPSRSGYVFAGWYDNVDCVGNLFDFSKQLTNDTILYAKWIKCENAIGLFIGTTTNITLDGLNEQRYMFVPLVSGNVTISTTGTVDTYGAIYDSTGTLLRRDDDTGTDSNFQIVYNVTAGQVYYIGVRGYSSSVNGTVPLIVSGATTPTAGGFVVTANRVEVVYGENFELPVPSTRDGYKFLGWMDANGVLYTDDSGTSIKTWDKAEDTMLVSKWEATVYTVTFVSNGGSAIESITLDYGARLDLNLYVPTRTGYTFGGWYLSASDTSAYNASTMPDENITLYAKWTTFALGTIKYDVDKKAVSIYDTISAELFDAVCIDTDGNLATFTVSSEGFTVGGTMTIRLTATSGGKTKQVTITDVKVYGMPTLDIEKTDKDYINVTDELNADLFGASGTDTFGEATNIEVTVIGEFEAGEIVTVCIASIDAAGNRVESRLSNIKVYGSPSISVNNSDLKGEDEITVDTIGATATDSFGKPVDVTIDKISYGFVNGGEYSYYTSTTQSAKAFTALNTESYKLYYKNGYSGDRTYISVYCKTTGTTVKAQSYYTNTTYAYFTFSVTAGYEYEIRTKAYSSSYTTQFYMYLESTSNNIGVDLLGDVGVVLKATDDYGNVGTYLANIKIYGLPTISDATTTDFKVGETVTVSSLGITAKDYFNNDLSITLTKKEGVQEAGEIVVYTATATDAAGNVTTKDIAVKFYDTPSIDVGRTNIKSSESISVNSFNVTAKDSFGNTLAVELEYISGTQTGGNYMTYKFTTTDGVGNSYSVTKTIAVYDVNQINLTYMNMASDLIKLTSKGEEFFAEATDSFGDACDITIEAASGYTLTAGKTISLYIVATDKAGNTKRSEVITGIKVYGMPTVELTSPDNGYSIEVNGNVSFLFRVIDSFGEEIYAEITTEDQMIAGSFIDVKVNAQDNAGNIVDTSYQIAVLSNEKPYVELYVDKSLWNTMYVDSSNTLPIPVKSGYVFYGWRDADEVYYTNSQGSITKTLGANNRLYAAFYLEGFTPISSSTQLKQISMDKNYILMCDIDLNNATWTPLGSSSNPYTGIFDGNGHVIKNYKITSYTASATYLGLFASNKGTIQDLGVEGFTITISTLQTYTPYVGGLVSNNSGRIQNCYAIGTITLKVGGSAGGLARSNTGVINNSYAKVNITVTSSTSGTGGGAGGLVGTNGGNINNCYATGDVSVTIKESNASSGGLAGSNSGCIANCFATGNVSVKTTSTTESYYTAYSGGLVADNVQYGYSNSSGTVVNCYRSSSQKVTLTQTYSGGSVSGSYGTAGTSTSVSNLKSKDWLVSNLWTLESVVWDFNSDDYPSLYWEDEYIELASITIASKNDFVKLSGQYLTLNYVLTTDINLSGISWTPMTFCGEVFDGNGHVISNCTISQKYDLMGLFAYNYGTISSINMTNLTISVSYTGTIYVGGLVAQNHGTICECSTTGNINLDGNGKDQDANVYRNYTGGLVGYNYGKINDCFSTCNITTTALSYGPSNWAGYGSCYNGGLVGYARTGSDISNSYATGTINGKAHTTTSATTGVYAGGLVGYVEDNCTIKYCFATGSITANATGTNSQRRVGYIVGAKPTSYTSIIISTCYHSSSASTSGSANSSMSTSVSVSKSLSTIKTVDFYINSLGWNSDIWTFVDGQYPTLK